MPQTTKELRLLAMLLPPDEKDLYELILSQVGAQIDSGKDDLPVLGFSALSWPPKQLARLLCPHLTRHHRYKLTRYCVGNGCEPENYARWLLMRKMLKDANAMTDVAGILNRFANHGTEGKQIEVLAWRATAPELPRSKRPRLDSSKTADGWKQAAGYGDPAFDKHDRPIEKWAWMAVPRPHESTLESFQYAFNLLNNAAGMKGYKFYIERHEAFNQRVKVVPIRDPDEEDDDGPDWHTPDAREELKREKL